MRMQDELLTEGHGAKYGPELLLSHLPLPARGLFTVDVVSFSRLVLVGSLTRRDGLQQVGHMVLVLFEKLMTC